MSAYFTYLRISPFLQHGSWVSSSKKSLVPALSSFAAICAKGRFCKIVTHFFKFRYFSRYHAQIFYKAKLDLSMQSLIQNRLTNFKFKKVKKSKEKTVVCSNTTGLPVKHHKFIGKIASQFLNYFKMKIK